MKKAGILAAILALASPPLVLAQIGYSQRAKEIGTNLKCMCRGCDMSAGLCAHPGGLFSGPCDTAKAELKEVDEMLGQRKSKQQIIDAFVTEYGTTVYVGTAKEGIRPGGLADAGVLFGAGIGPGGVRGTEMGGAIAERAGCGERSKCYKDITSMPVVERGTRRLLGIVSLDDLLKARTRHLEEERRREQVLRFRYFGPGASAKLPPGGVASPINPE